MTRPLCTIDMYCRPDLARPIFKSPRAVGSPTSGVRGTPPRPVGDCACRGNLTWALTRGRRARLHAMQPSMPRSLGAARLHGPGERVALPGRARLAGTSGPCHRPRQAVGVLFTPMTVSTDSVSPSASVILPPFESHQRCTSYRTRSAADSPLRVQNRGKEHGIGSD
jgi:hypothetical protein